MSAPDYVPVAQARALPGLRIAFTQGVPGPWSVAARAFYDIKKIAYVAVPQEGGTPNEELKAWTGQTSAPVAMLDDDRPRAHWSEVLILAEQLAAEPRLIPADQDERTLMFGLCHEICGDDGLRSEEHTSELQSLMRISYAVFCLKKKKTTYAK